MGYYKNLSTISLSIHNVNQLTENQPINLQLHRGDLNTVTIFILNQIMHQKRKRINNETSLKTSITK